MLTADQFVGCDDSPLEQQRQDSHVLLKKSGVSLSFCAGGQWGFSAGHFYFFL